MVVYGVAILAACLIVGKVLGDGLGLALGVEANVGGVGIAMLLLVVICHRFSAVVTEVKQTASGIAFWSAMYIPIVVAMAAKQNVIAAVDGGPVALLAGFLAVLGSLALVPVLSGSAGGETDDEPEDASAPDGRQ